MKVRFLRTIFAKVAAFRLISATAPLNEAGVEWVLSDMASHISERTVKHHLGRAGDVLVRCYTISRRFRLKNFVGIQSIKETPALLRSK